MSDWKTNLIVATCSLVGLMYASTVGPDVAELVAIYGTFAVVALAGYTAIVLAVFGPAGAALLLVSVMTVIWLLVMNLVKHKISRTPYQDDDELPFLEDRLNVLAARLPMPMALLLLVLLAVLLPQAVEAQASQRVLVAIVAFGSAVSFELFLIQLWMIRYALKDLESYQLRHQPRVLEEH